LIGGGAEFLATPSPKPQNTFPDRKNQASMSVLPCHAGNRKKRLWLAF